MAIFPDPAQAAASARELSRAVSALLAGRSLGIGVGLHAGLLVKGLLGSAGVKFYDVIGDTVNTAKRVEGAAAAGEGLLSETTRRAIGAAAQVGAAREIAAQGKEAPVMVYPLI